MSDSDKKVKTYKNSGRDKPLTHKKYVPQYQLMGIEPEEVRSAVVPGPNVPLGMAQPLPITNPRSRRSPVRQPYARIIPSPVGRGRDPVPNVGNNMEHTWSSVDGEIIDDLTPETDQDHPMIDNNDFVTEQSLDESFDTEEKAELISFEEPKLPEVFPVIKDDEYILLVQGEVLSTGSFDKIEQETKALVFGEHEFCDGNPIPIDSLMVLKKVKIKMGVFLV